MRKSRKICCRITPRRILGAVVLAASMVNLIIVGTAFELTFSEAVPTATASQTAYPLTATLIIPTATSSMSPVMTLGPTDTPVPTLTSSPTVTFTATATPTSTDTPSPSPTRCVPQYNWPVYIVVAGDNLSRVAAATGTTYNVLMTANCLPDTLIYVGQRLYVPRLPATPTNTTPPNTPTEFRDENVWCSANGVFFSVIPYDPEGIADLQVSYRLYGDPSSSSDQMTADGETYYGSGLPPKETIFTIYYTFSATDTLGVKTVSREYQTPLDCSSAAG